MLEIFNLLRWILLDLFRSRRSLEGEVIALRHQLNVLRRRTPKRPALRSFDRFILVLLYRLAPTVLDAMTIVRPETIMRWHRAGFRTFWRWKSRRRPGRPKVALEVRQLIREMSLANPFWGAPRIHGELLKLGIDVGQTSVAKYMARHRRPPSQGWRTFLLNHADGIASIDLFVVPTISFRLLYGLLILRHDRRRILWLGVTAHPTAEWITQQVTEACGWESAPHYLIRDRDRIYGEAFTCRIRAMGIRDRPTAPRSPWQNGHAERLIGSIRRECLDHVIVCGERHLRYVLRSYARYYNGVRTHLSLAKARPYPEPSRQLPCFGTRETKHDLLPVSGWGEERRGGGAGAFRFPVRTPFPGPLVPFSLARFPVRSDQVPSRRASCPSGFMLPCQAARRTRRGTGWPAYLPKK